MKICPIHSLSNKSRLDFLPPQHYYITFLAENIKSLIVSNEFLNFTPVSFNITPVILLSLWSAGTSRQDYSNPRQPCAWNFRLSLLVVTNWFLSVFTNFL